VVEEMEEQMEMVMLGLLIQAVVDLEEQDQVLLIQVKLVVQV